MADQVFEVSLRRMDTSQPWGFRLKGGAQQGMPLFMEQVAPKGRAGQAGVQAGDVVLAICHSPVHNYTHDQAKGEILRAGNELDLTLQRGVMGGQAPQQPQERVEVVEEPVGRLGGPTYKEVQPLTYKVLQDELEHGGTGEEHIHAAHKGRPAPQYHAPGQPIAEGSRPAGPASIFSRKKEDRSAYLKASGPTIQKAYGQRH